MSSFWGTLTVWCFAGRICRQLIKFPAFGLIVAIYALVFIASMAEEGWKVQKHASSWLLRLAAGSYVAFVRGSQAAVPGLACFHHRLRIRHHGTDFTNLSLGFSVAFTPINLALCVRRMHARHADWRAAWHRPRGHYRHAAASDLRAATGVGADHAWPVFTTALSTVAQPLPSLVNLPGESSSVVTCIDGYQMARRGRAGPALAAAGMGSFFAGCVGTLILAAFAPPLTELAFKFGPAEYFALMVLGLIGAVVLASGSLLKAIAMIVLGLLMGLDGHRCELRCGALQF